jgi:hypothetical protein
MHAVALPILLSVSLATFTLFGKFAFDMWRDRKYQEASFLTFAAILPGLISALYLTNDPAMSAVVRNVILGVLGATAGACLAIWLGYVIQAQPIQGNLEFGHPIRQEGEAGHYFGYLVVRNTSISEKMHNCRCEVTELAHSWGDTIKHNIGLTIRGQQDEYFQLDQNAENEIPLFEIDQTGPEFWVYLLGATEKIKLRYDSYRARIRGYSDTGFAAEITVEFDPRRHGFFDIIA